MERRRQWDLKRRVVSWARAKDIDEMLSAFADAHGEDGHEHWVRWGRGESRRLRAVALAPPTVESDPA
jgi:hypothetical protein